MTIVEHFGGQWELPEPKVVGECVVCKQDIHDYEFMTCEFCEQPVHPECDRECCEDQKRND